MKQVYIIKNNPKLLLFFAGWQPTKHPLNNIAPKASDYMICYDYRTLDFDILHPGSNSPASERSRAMVHGRMGTPHRTGFRAQRRNCCL